MNEFNQPIEGFSVKTNLVEKSVTISSPDGRYLKLSPSEAEYLSYMLSKVKGYLKGEKDEQ